MSAPPRTRDSILAHGLDWTRMGAARGIAGSTAPEADGVFLCADEFEAGFFVQMNNTGGPVDIWAVTGIGEWQLIESGNGFQLLPGTDPAQPGRSHRTAGRRCPASTPARASEEGAAQEGAPIIALSLLGPAG